MSRQSRELKKQQERAKKYGCDGRCYWSTGMCPSVEICDETRVGEAIATANRADHSLSNDSHGSNHRDRRSNHADLVNICRIRRKKEWRTIKFTTTQMHTWKAT